ncbi:Protein EBS1 [Meyerozyma sp. JA9]|nr:Protein EBS1 [Meyerozyma sp. JA9]
MTAPFFKQQETSVYKKQLEDYLNRKNIDQSLILGFTNSLQSKLQSWILADFNRYFDCAHAGEDVDFVTIKYFEFLWSEIHYPIIKFFQSHHADYYNQNLLEFKKCQNKKTSFKLKSVEIRKINEAFVKVVHQFRSFYMALLKHFSTHFKNPLLPSNLLTHFGLTVPSAAIESTNANVQANLIFLIHRCLLCLGDLSRHRAFNETNYVLPCSSQKLFQKYRLYKARDQMKNKTAKDLQLINECKTQCYAAYEPSMNYYKLCIMLLPTLNEPYNHIGMIHNIVGNKVEACYWFLRSRFTRIPNYDLGLKNLESIMVKGWFQDQLSEAFKTNWQGGDLHHTSQIVLLNLIGYHYFPQRYRHGELLYGTETYDNVEREFLSFEFSQSHFQQLMSTTSEYINHYVHSLSLLIMFSELLSENNNQKLFRLTKLYISGFFTLFETIGLKAEVLEGSLVFLRLALAHIKESKSFSKYFFRDDAMVVSSCSLFNEILAKFVDIHEPVRNNMKPTRSYYYTEDVLFKDFSPIKYQFKDFNDDDLFSSGSVDLLMGKSEITEDERTENTSRRALAVVLLWKRLLQKSRAVKLDEVQLRFVALEIVPENKQPSKKKKEKAKKEKSKSKDVNQSKEPPAQRIGQKPVKVLKKVEAQPENVQPPAIEPKGIDDIEAVIRNHTNMLQSEIAETSPLEKREETMDKMVSNLVEDSEGKTSDVKSSDGMTSNGAIMATPILNHPQQQLPTPEMGYVGAMHQGHFQQSVQAPLQPLQQPLSAHPVPPIHPQPYFNPFPVNNPHGVPPPPPGYVHGQVPFQGQPVANGMYGQNGYYQVAAPYGYSYPPPQ